MKKKNQNKLKKVSACTQIFLLVSMSFALSFLMSDNFVSSQLTNPARSSGGVAALSNAGPGGVKSFVWQEDKYAWDAAKKAFIRPDGQSLMNVPSSGTTSIEGGTSGAGLKESISGYYQGNAFSGGVPGALTAGVLWAVTAFVAVKMIGSFIGLDPGAQKALEKAALGGFFVGGTLHAATTNQVLGLGTGNTGIQGFLSSGGGQFAAGLAIAAVIFIATYSSTSKKMVNFQCLPFEPPIGGAKCEQCNADPLRPCSEYRCKSLGQACQLLNAGTKDEQCAWVSRNDAKSPTISPWNGALYPSGLKYVPDTAIRPPAIGTKIVAGNGCLPAFTPLQFGVVTDEPAQCKIDYNHTIKFDEMSYYFGDTNYYQYNHTQKLRLPGPNTGNASSAPLLQNDGQFALYVRCRDANGNENVDEYAFSFCVDKGPDTTPPIIEEFSIPSGGYIAYNQDTTPIEVYVNEPADCKWSTQSKAYEEMENSMQCQTESYQVNANLQYTCSGNITGIQSKADNTFYFRCKDQPGKPDNERNVNVQSTELILKGSQPLNIIHVEPNETITGSTDVVSVNLQLETDDGAENGKAICSFSPTEEIADFITMFETNDYLHKQSLSLTNGNYKYFFRCVDAGGNLAEASTSFNVKVDKEAPKVTRVYKQDALKIVVNEDAECSYSLASCNFNFADGLKMIYSNPDIKNNLYADWRPGISYYIKCRDIYGNEPGPNQCSITASAIELSAKI